jgi:hypothetical protein
MSPVAPLTRSSLFALDECEQLLTDALWRGKKKRS